MKHWFKHRFGYVNITEEAIYATKSGNWSEIKGLEERNPFNFKKEDTLSKIKIGLYLFLVLGANLFGMIYGLISDQISLTLSLGLPIIAKLCYTHLIPGTGAGFQIPWSKITAIELKGENVRINFKDANDEEAQHLFARVSKEGLEFFRNHKIQQV